MPSNELSRTVGDYFSSLNLGERSSEISSVSSEIYYFIICLIEGIEIHRSKLVQIYRQIYSRTVQ